MTDFLSWGWTSTNHCWMTQIKFLFVLGFPPTALGNSFETFNHGWWGDDGMGYKGKIAEKILHTLIFPYISGLTASLGNYGRYCPLHLDTTRWCTLYHFCPCKLIDFCTSWKRSTFLKLQNLSWEKIQPKKPSATVWNSNLVLPGALGFFSNYFSEHKSKIKSVFSQFLPCGIGEYRPRISALFLRSPP